MTLPFGIGAEISAVETVVNKYRTDSASQELGGADATGGKFEVDLPTLYQYYNDVSTTFNNLQDRITTLKSNASASVPSTDITGVSQSMKSTVDGAVGPQDSLLGALVYTSQQLSKHLTAIHDIYMKYIEADKEHAASLNAAGNPSAAGYTVFAPPPAAKVDISKLFIF